MLKTESDQKILRLAQHGDRDAFRTLYESNANVIFKYVRARTGHHEAEDITAEVFCTAWRKLPDFEWRGIPLEAWLITIAKNLLKSKFRRAAVLTIQPGSVDLTEMASGEQPESLVIAALSTKVIAAGLDRLKPAHRQVLIARFLDELSVAESATRLGCSEQSVRVRTFRALQELRGFTLGELDE